MVRQFVGERNKALESKTLKEYERQKARAMNLEHAVDYATGRIMDVVTSPAPRARTPLAGKSRTRVPAPFPAQVAATCQLAIPITNCMTYLYA